MSKDNLLLDPNPKTLRSVLLNLKTKTFINTGIRGANRFKGRDEVTATRTRFSPENRLSYSRLYCVVLRSHTSTTNSTEDTSPLSIHLFYRAHRQQRSRTQRSCLDTPCLHCGWVSGCVKPNCLGICRTSSS